MTRASTAALILALVLAVPVHGVKPRPLLDDLADAQKHAEALARAVAVAALDRDPTALRAATRTLTRADAARRRIERAPTGLADDARLLAIALRPAGPSRRDELARFIDASDGDVRRVAEGLRAADDGAQTARLLADDRHDRRATLVNDAVRPFGIGTNLLAIVNPVLLAGSALDTIVSTARNLLRYDHLSTREREALARYHAAVARNVTGERDPELARASRRLTAKRAAALCEQAIDDAEAALDAPALARAATRLRFAGTLDGCDTAALDTRLAAAVGAAAEAHDAAIWPAPDPAVPRDPREESAWCALAVAIVDADPARIDGTARALADGDGPLAPGAALAQALAAHLRADEPATRRILDDLEDDDTPIGQWAAGMLAGPEFGQADALAAAERAHRLKVARYVALGGTSGTGALKGAAQVAAYGAAGAQSLGIANAIGLLARAYGAWRRDPAPNDAIVARGEEYLARHPDAADRDEIHHRLAAAYERGERYDRALLHLRTTADPDPDDVERLEDKLAEQMLGRARQDDADPTLLAAIATHFPETDAAETARKALEERTRHAGLTVTREQLERHPDLLGPDGLDLPPGLLDGHERNGELARDGVALAAMELRLSLEPDDRVDRRSLDRPAAARAYAAAETLLYREALARREEGEERGRFEDYIPFFITGTVGDAGVNVYPGIKLRPYSGAHPERYR